MTLVIGCDPSAKKIALVALSDTTKTQIARSYVLYDKGNQTVESLAVAMRSMEEFLETTAYMAGPMEHRYAWVEDPLVGRGGAVTTMKQAYVGGIVRAMLVNAGFTTYGVNVSSWKKAVCDNGHAGKAEIKQVVASQWPKVAQVAGNDGDLIDAGAIALFGVDVLRRTKAMEAQAALATEAEAIPAAPTGPARRSVRR